MGPLTLEADVVAKLGATFSVSDPAASASDPDPTDVINLTEVTFEGGAGVNCGEIDTDEIEGVDFKLTGAACATLALRLGGNDLGTLGFRAEEIFPVDADLTSPEDWFVFIPDDLVTNLAEALISWDTLSEGVDLLVDLLQGSLDSDSYGTKIPLIGDQLSAGADVINQFRTGVLEPLEEIAAKLEGLTAVDIKTCVEGLLNDVLGDNVREPPDSCVVTVGDASRAIRAATRSAAMRCSAARTRARRTRAPRRS